MHAPWIMIAITMLATACMPTAKSVTTDKHADVVARSLAMPLADANKTGSLWAEGGTPMFTDTKARQVGDLVTILVEEKASATRSLGTKKSKQGSRKTALNAVLGYETQLANKLTGFQPSAAVDISDEKNFDGSGSTSNSDTLTASVTAVVTKVYPNGNMQVIGRRLVTINQQPQELVFTGVIRPVDVSPDNTIPSSKVAQANVSYGSGGELATVAHEGWMSQTLDMIWPF